MAGYSIKFVKESNLHTADILLNGVEFEIKSPKTSCANSLEHLLKKALKQSPNIIIDTPRMKNSRDDNIRRFLIAQARSRKQIKRMLMITKKEKIVDIIKFIWYIEPNRSFARRRRYLPQSFFFSQNFSQKMPVFAFGRNLRLLPGVVIKPTITNSDKKSIAFTLDISKRLC